MSSHPLDGARLKITRAQEHLDSALGAIAAFSQVYSTRIEWEIQGDRCRVFLVDDVPSPPRLSVAIGDFVTNCRAALDYVVWELAARYFNPPLDSQRSRDRSIYFPIAIKGPTEHGYVAATKMLADRGVPGDAVQIIRDCQPHVGGYEPLQWLHALVNHDKHRALIVGGVLCSGVQLTFEVGDRWPSFPCDAIGLDSVAIQVDADLLAAVQEGRVQMCIETLTHVACKNVAIPPMELSTQLRQILRTVEDVIPRFDSFFT